MLHTGISPAERAFIVSRHNELRARVARGGTGQPGAADMRELSWDEELGRKAATLGIL